MTKAYDICNLFPFHLTPRIQSEVFTEEIAQLFSRDEHIRLYQLTDLATQIAEIQASQTPQFRVPYHLILSADHGFVQSRSHGKASASLLWATKVARGQYFVNYLCNTHGFALRIANAGLATPPNPALGLVNVSAGYGTADFFSGDAITIDQLQRCVDNGRQLVTNIAAQGCNILSLGFLSHGTRIVAALWAEHLLGIPLYASLTEARMQEWTPMGITYTSLYEHLVQVRERLTSLTDILLHYGGFELLVAIAVILQGAELKMTLLVDSYPILVALYVAYLIAPEVLDYTILTHMELLEGMEVLAARLGILPVLRLGLSASEGIGALEAYGIINSALHLLSKQTEGILR